MAKTKKPLTKQQQRFKDAVKEYVKDTLNWYGEVRVVRIEFPTEDTFHVHIQEDWSSNFHARGELCDGFLNILKVSNSMSADMFQQMMEFLTDYDA